jgi:hypothetical protein
MKASDLVNRALFGLAIALAAAISGCAGDPAEQDLCTQFDELVVAVDDLRGLRPESASTDDLRSSAANAQAHLDQLQHVSEGRHDSAISRLRAAVTAFREAALDAGSEAAAISAPQLEAALEDVREAYGALAQSLEVQCADQ